MVFSTTEMSGLKSINDLLKERTIWEKILVPMATMDFDELKEKLNNQEIPISLQAKSFVLQSKSALFEEITNLSSQRDAAIRDIDYSIKRITEQKLQADNMTRQIEEKKKSLESTVAISKFEEQVTKIKSLPYIKSLSFLTTGLNIETEPIQIDDGPYLGGYKVTYSTTNKTLVIFNEKNPYTGGEILAHPHIPQGGQPCFGNYSDIFYRFETGEYYIGMEILYKFLSTYNPEDVWGRRLYLWDKEYYFKDMKERGLLRYIDEYYYKEYFEIMGEHLPHVRFCEECGLPRRECACSVCRVCHNHVDECTCWICPECGENVDEGNCYCDRCESCGELIEDCECERCSQCGRLIDEYNDYDGSCDCPRCPEDYSYLVDIDDDAECRECENFDCEYNQNRTHPDHPDYVYIEPFPTQEEQLPGIE
jgi:hypothetical protein